MRRIILYILVFSFLCLPQNVNALMSSDNYTIFADDFNSGLVFESSTYKLEGTVGESPVGNTASTSYQIIGGYNAMSRNSLSLNISDSSINLGTLVNTQINSAATTISVTTDDDSGYTLSMSSVNWTQSSLTAVSDGAVTIGSEEYGFSISGTDANGSLTGQDNAVTAVTLMSSSTALASSGVLIFKASISGSTSAGNRTQSITITVSNNL